MTEFDEKLGRCRATNKPEALEAGQLTAQAIIEATRTDSVPR
jgi:hypothetical protein